MKITSKEKCSKCKDKISIYVDGDYCFNIAEEDYLRLGLYEKDEITLEEIEHIKTAVNFRTAKSTAIKYMSYKLRSEKELRIKLEMEAFDLDTVNNVVEELKSIGYVNDKIYAQKYSFDRVKLKPISKGLLRNELKNKGITDDIIEEVLNNFDIDEVTLAERLTRKKFGKYDYEDDKIIRKIYLFLQHRGFNSEVIGNVIQNIRKSSV